MPGFTAGETEVVNPLVFENLKAGNQARRIGCAPIAPLYLRKAAKVAVGIAGVGDGNLAKTGSPRKHQTEELPDGHG